MHGAAEKVVELARGGRMSILVDTDTQPRRDRPHRARGHLPPLRNRTTAPDLVAGVTPGKAGQDVEGVPVFNTMHAAVEETGANTAMIFVPPPFAADSILEAADAGIGLVIAITEGIPPRPAARLHAPEADRRHAPGRPQLPGILSPGKANVGIIPAHVLLRGQRRPGVALGDADLPDRQRARPARLRQLVASSASAATRSPGSHFIDVIELFEQDDADRADRDVRRDRRRRRGARCRLHR